MEANDDILYLTFNQDSTSLSVGTKRGYQIYALNQLDELNKLHEYEINDVYIVERLFSSSLVTLVSLVAPRKLQVCHFQKGLELCNQSYSNTILAIRLNRTRLVVCLEESLYIHNIRDMKVLHTIRDTPPNSQGICELCPSEISYLAYPGSVQSGEVQVFDASNLQAVTMITAHSSRIAALKFSPDGSKLATASEKGTVIKVFSIPNGEKMFEFRRGMKRCATIYSLAFSADALFLCCSSSTETVHVFKLEHHDEKEARPIAEEQTAGVQSWMNYVSKTAASYLPGPVSDMFQQDRAFAQAKLPHGGCKSVCALILLRQKLLLLVASVEGFLYAFDFNKDDGGECQLIKQHRLITNRLQQQQQDVAQSDGTAKRKSSPPSVGRQNSQRSYAATVQKENDAGSNPDASANTDFQSQVKNFDSARQHGTLNLDDVQEFPPMTHTSG